MDFLAISSRDTSLYHSLRPSTVMTCDIIERFL